MHLYIQNLNKNHGKKIKKIRDNLNINVKSKRKTKILKMDKESENLFTKKEKTVKRKKKKILEKT